MYTVVSGEKFKEMFPSEDFYKLTNRPELHFELQYNDGLNKDPKPFNPTGTCQPGGIYFTNEHNIGHWVMCLYPTPQWIRKVKICDDAKVYIEEKKFKIDKITLLERESIWDNEKWCSLIVQQNSDALKYVIKQTPMMCELAVQQNGLVLQYVNKQTPIMCELAVQQNGLALQYVNKQTPELCELSVQQNGLALQYVIDQTPELCELSVRQNSLALQYVIDRTPELYELAVRQNGLALQYVIDQTPELCELAVRQNGCALTIIKKPTYELCELAARQLKKVHIKQMISLLANK